jgi:hypothetical protein
MIKHMKNHMTKTKLIALALAPAAMLAFTSCTTTHTSPFTKSNPNASYEKGVPGGVVVDTYELTTRVTAIDAKQREVTTVGQDGNTTTFECGPEVRNFDQIRVGDQVKVLLTEQLAVAVTDPKNPSRDGSSTTVLLAPKGAKPGGIVAETRQITATLTGIDTLRHRATFRFPDGTVRHYAVRPDVDLAPRHVGEEFAVRATKSMAIWVKTP